MDMIPMMQKQISFLDSKLIATLSALETLAKGLVGLVEDIHTLEKRIKHIEDFLTTKEKEVIDVELSPNC